jgi:hypothetical protein
MFAFVAGVYSYEYFFYYFFTYFFIMIPPVLGVVAVYHFCINYLSKKYSLFNKFTLRVLISFIIISLLMLGVYIEENISHPDSIYSGPHHIDLTIFIIIPPVFAVILTTVYYLVGKFQEEF